MTSTRLTYLLNDLDLPPLLYPIHISRSSSRIQNMMMAIHEQAFARLQGEPAQDQP
jgi:hypothetical protein